MFEFDYPFISNECTFAAAKKCIPFNGNLKIVFVVKKEIEAGFIPDYGIKSSNGCQILKPSSMRWTGTPVPIEVNF